MAEYLPKLDVTLMFGVGAAFDFLAGKTRQAPRWMQRSGLEVVFSPLLRAPPALEALLQEQPALHRANLLPVRALEEISLGGLKPPGSALDLGLFPTIY